MRSFYFKYWFKSGLIIAFLSIFPVTNGAPTIDIRVKPSLVAVCGNATFTCETDSIANVKIWWTLNGNKLNHFSNTTSTPKKTISTLQLTCAKLEHTGTYTCNFQSIADNWSTNKLTIDHIYSNSIRLQVGVPFRIFSTRFVKGEIGKPVTLSCKVIGLPVPQEIEWLKGERVLSSNENIKISQRVVNDTTLSSTLEIHNLTKSDISRYTCQATTNVDFSSTYVTIFTKGLEVPTVSSSSSIEIIDPSKVNLKWYTRSSDEGVWINLHRVSIKWRRSKPTSGSSDGLTELRVVSVPNNKTGYPYTDHIFLMKDLVEGYYTVMVKACNGHIGCSDWSAEATFFLPRYSSPPQGVISTCRQDNTKLESYVDIAWSKPASPKAEIKYYKVKLMGSASYVNSTGTRTHEEDEIRDWQYGSSFTIKVRVKPNTNYTAQVCAETVVGCGNFSEVTADTFCSTPPNAPKEMPHFELTKLEPTEDCRQFKLDLKGINQRYGSIQCYNIILYKMNHRNESIPQPHEIMLSNYIRVHEDNSYGAYIAESIKSEEFPKEITLGDNIHSQCETLPDENAVSDGELSPDAFYSGFVVVTVIGEDNVVLRNWSNLFSPIKTGSLTKNNFTAIVIGIVVGLIIVVTIFVIFITIRRYKWQPRLNEIFCCVLSRSRKSNKSLPPIPEEVNLRQRPADNILSGCNYEAVSRHYEDVRASYDDNVEIEFPGKIY